jgi:hypothetical protein
MDRYRTLGEDHEEIARKIEDFEVHSSHKHDHISIEKDIERRTKWK